MTFCCNCLKSINIQIKGNKGEKYYQYHIIFVIYLTKF